MSDTTTLNGRPVAKSEVDATRLVLRRLDARLLVDIFLFAHDFPLRSEHVDALKEAKLIEPDGTMRPDTKVIVDALIFFPDSAIPCLKSELG